MRRTFCGSMIALAAMASPLSAESYPDVVSTSHYVPVRDGTRLAMSVYRPAVNTKAIEKPLPVIFVFTPYRGRSKDADGKVTETAMSDNLGLRSLLRAGYVVAVADIRGKGASFGHRRGFQDRTEALDGRDLVEWLAKQPYSDGSVGMVGCSYLGGAAFQVATTAPPSLKAAFIGASDLDKYAFVRNGGITAQFNTRPDEKPEVDLATVPMDEDRDGSMLKAAVAEHAENTPMGPLWYGMPYRDSMSAFTGTKFWEEVGPYTYLDTVKRAGIATYFWGNWRDEPTSQVILSAANLGSRFLAGPGSHCVPPEGFDLPGEIVHFFDHYLKHQDPDYGKLPRATYWVEGLNGTGGYVTSSELPGVRSHPLPWFLSQAGFGAQTSGAQGASTFTVDYDLPPAEYFAFWPRPMTEHGLGFAGGALQHDLKLVGYPVAQLKVSSDNPNADVFVYLDRIRADGTSEVISFGRLKLSHHKLSLAPYETLGLPWHSGFEKDVERPAAGEEVSLSIAMTPVSLVVPAGDRLRFVVAGADPRQRNLTDIKLDPAPRITVVWGGQDGSRVDLPLAN
ncbi:CocE/NonD family hydrolase [Croceibacterium aestuarii]|uniref:CocE/NonD family hydrolase n=1 Tax=Croceibacterium aestuarii TaxID=3064139 RepID=UPI00272EDE5D|nr:CocE/NonD family hydrolase [Croceibacterium sp. D39]